MSELAHERSGPERYLSTFPLLAALLASGPALGEAALTEIGSVTARLWALRALSLRVQDHRCACCRPPSSRRRRSHCAVAPTRSCAD